MMIQETNMTLVLQKIFVRYSKGAWVPLTIKAADQGNFVSGGIKQHQETTRN